MRVPASPANLVARLFFAGKEIPAAGGGMKSALVPCASGSQRARPAGESRSGFSNQGWGAAVARSSEIVSPCSLETEERTLAAELGSRDCRAEGVSEAHTQADTPAQEIDFIAAPSASGAELNRAGSAADSSIGCAGSLPAMKR